MLPILEIPSGHVDQLSWHDRSVVCGFLPNNLPAFPTKNINFAVARIYLHVAGVVDQPLIVSTIAGCRFHADAEVIVSLEWSRCNQCVVILSLWPGSITKKDVALQQYSNTPLSDACMGGFRILDSASLSLTSLWNCDICWQVQVPVDDSWSWLRALYEISYSKLLALMAARDALKVRININN